MREAWLPSSNKLSSSLSAAAAAAAGHRRDDHVSQSSSSSQRGGASAAASGVEPVWSEDFCPLLAAGGLRVPEEPLLAAIQSEFFATAADAAAVDASIDGEGAATPRDVSAATFKAGSSRSSSRVPLPIVVSGGARPSAGSGDSPGSETNTDLVREAFFAIFADPAAGAYMKNISGMRSGGVGTYAALPNSLPTQP